ncbi:heterokaryon incompatibility protein-domain-containing protein, partial [Clohesyomyces aquaticus]
FRLLTILPGLPHEAICCSQMTATLKDPPAYKTLSYAWGSPTRNHTVFVDNKKLLVTENLHTALLHLRNEQRALCIWIDAICINQQNLCERSQQVGMMRDIYKKSKRVYVWLGTPRTHARNL